MLLRRAELPRLLVLEGFYQPQFFYVELKIVLSFINCAFVTNK